MPSCQEPRPCFRATASDEARQSPGEIAREFGATDIIEARGNEATQAVLGLTRGIGADAALEWVGTAQSTATAFAVARPGSTVGIVGVPHGQVPFAETFFRNAGWRGGPAPARIYIPNCSTTSSTAPSTPAGSSITRPTLTTSPTPTGPWTSGGPSSRWYEWVRSDDGSERANRLAPGPVGAHRRGGRDRAGLPPPRRQLRPYVTMWVVRAGDDLYVRSAYGPDNPWYRRATTSGADRIRAGSIERDVSFAQAPAKALDAMPGI